MRVVIVGGGVIGLATAWAAARRGHGVELFEQGPLPNPLSASVDQHRLTRIPYGDQRGYTRLMAAAFRAWDVVWSALGESHYAETGFLSLSTEENDWTDRSRATLAALALPHEIVARDGLAERFPMLRVDDARYGLYARQAGVLFADRIVDGFLTLLRDSGVRLHDNARVAAVDASSATVTLAGGRSVGADAVVIAGGVHTGALAPWLSRKPVPLRQIVAYVAPPPTLAEAWATAPIMMDLGGPRGMFLAPPVAGRSMKLGCGALNHPSDPVPFVPARDGEGLRVMSMYERRLARFEEFTLLQGGCCYYANTGDQRFIAERSGRALAFTGCSGHAFKFAALLGFGLADALDRGETALEWMTGDDRAYDAGLLQRA
ncbi:FAD-dependent oxidoreductase [Inquilinus sp. OTU3971]|uniref:FAD-dependent oxidoreductase n=1 Tax=Inquilinus sp. OTU3971 TaxID=3043855 RepID=UPI00313D1428